jgi:hypothetical protein
LSVILSCVHESLARSVFYSREKPKSARWTMLRSSR